MKISIIIIIFLFTLNINAGHLKIFGKVRDHTDFAIPDHQILIVEENLIENIKQGHGAGEEYTIDEQPGVYETSTSKHGNYRILNVPPGRYKMYIRLQGWTGTERTLILTGSRSLRIDDFLQLHHIEDSIDMGIKRNLIDPQSPALKYSIKLIRPFVKTSDP